MLDRTFAKIATIIAAFLTLLFVLFVINQTAAVLELAAGISPTAHTIALYGLLVTYAVLLAVPAILILRLPKPLTPPAALVGEEYAHYLTSLGKRLKRNPRLAGRELTNREGIEAAIDHLGSEADEIIRSTAGSVFVTTAVSQNGRLDGFLMLGAQSRLVWRVAHVYYQRPTIRDMLNLYANVGSTAFVASELDDVDIAEQIEPVLSSAFGTVAGFIPGFQLASSLFVNSVLTGSANAFLTLRVGVITKRYCATLSRQEKKSLRRAATTEAAGMLGSIVLDGTTQLSKAFAVATAGKVAGVVTAAGKGVKTAGEAVVDTSSAAVSGVGRGAKTVGSTIADASSAAVSGVGSGVRSAGDAVSSASSSVVEKVKPKKWKRKELSAETDEDKEETASDGWDE